MIPVAELPGFPQFDDYTDAFVAFIDLLGFKERVRGIRNRDDFDSLGLVLYTLQKEATSYSKADAPYLADLQMTAVSDSVIVSIPYLSPISATVLIALLHRLQYDLLALAPLRVTLRGYVARGRIYHRTGFLFGTGYQEAYEGEFKSHGPPRIVIAPDIVLEAQKARELHGNADYRSLLESLRCDGDGAYFINYLRPFGDDAENPSEQFRQEARDIIGFARAQALAFASTPSIREKYEWLVKYAETIAQETAT